MDRTAAERAFRVRVAEDISNPKVLSAETLEVKKGPQAWKAAKLRTYGDRDTGEIRKREFSVEQYAAKLWGAGYRFDEKPERRWYCEDAEIDALLAFLNGAMPSTGTYIRVDDVSLPEAMLESIHTGDLSLDRVAEVIKTLASAPGLVDQLIDSEGIALLSGLFEIRRQHKALGNLRAVVENPRSTEHDIQKVLDDNWWIFGGHFIRKEDRRRLTVLDIIDIPLIRADGSLHIVELKQANVPQLVEKPRKHLIVSGKVHEAAMQCVNYLRSLDHKRDSIWTDFQIDCSRATAVVVIGHPLFVKDCTERELAEALRTYNAALNRVEVITYKDLIDGAARALSAVASGELVEATRQDEEPAVEEEPTEGMWNGPSVQ
ncbi:Shedu anti-phage system protein SduA domain-containing protein [Planobispora siamensis]|uniref:Shedu anti-phage system protein SduA domain-containing protein n=1 Tax=Planobispora siamensis TaxID=936338 RepID=UPI001950EF1C|nr:Shedu anti-phage system protein SduA domain-containing protein [Planobispora siamensis]